MCIHVHILFALDCLKLSQGQHALESYQLKIEAGPVIFMSAAVYVTTLLARGLRIRSNRKVKILSDIARACKVWNTPE